MHEGFSKQYSLRLLNDLAGLQILTVKEYEKAKLCRHNIDKWDAFKQWILCIKMHNRI